MAPSTDDPTGARRDAVQRELRDRDETAEDTADDDLVGMVGEEQRRLREADRDDGGEDA